MLFLVPRQEQTSFFLNHFDQNLNAKSFGIIRFACGSITQNYVIQH